MNQTLNLREQAELLQSQLDQASSGVDFHASRVPQPSYVEVPVSKAQPTKQNAPNPQKNQDPQPQKTSSAPKKSSAISNFKLSSLVLSQKVNLNSEFRPFVFRFLGGFFVFTTFRALMLLVPVQLVIITLSLILASGLYLNRPSWLTTSSSFLVAYLFFRLVIS